MTSENIYFDSAAAMRPARETADFLRNALLSHYANQESIHAAGLEIRRELDGAARMIADALGAPDMSVHFTSCGTDAARLFGYYLAALPKHANVVTTRLEHPAVLAAIRSSGCETRFAPLDRTGGIDLEKFPRVLDRQTGCAMIHWVQSETGRMQDFAAIERVFRSHAAPDALLFADAIQGAGKLPPPVKQLDGLLLSGHKFGGPGAGAVLLREGAKPANERMQHFRSDYLAGRTDPAYALTLSFAAVRAVQNMDQAYEHVSELNRLLRDELSGMKLPNGREPVISLAPELASPYILHLRLPGYQGAVVVRLLSERGIYVSSGSACQAETDSPSPALLAMGLRGEHAYSGLRLSFSPANTLDEARAFLTEFRDVMRNY